MKRFRFPLLAASALLVLMACSSTDESVKDDLKNAEPLPVNFGTYVNQGVTRAGTTGEIASGADLKDKGGFGVFAYYTDNVEYSGNQIPNFMYNQAVTGSGTTDITWSYSPVKYWPNEYGNGANSDGVDMLSFFAYAPYVAVTPSTGQLSGTAVDKTSGITALTRNTATGDPMVKYIVGSSPVDLLWGVKSTTSPTDPTNGLPHINKVRSAGTGDDKITFNFKHALAKLITTVKYDGSAIDANSAIYIRSVTITGFASKGMLNLNNITANQPLWLSYDGGEPTYEGMTFNDGRKDGREGAVDGAQDNEKNKMINSAFVQTNTSTQGVTNSASPLINNLYVIPTGGSESVDVTIVYDIETKDANLSTKLSDGTTAGVSIENRITKTNVFSTSTLKGFEAGKVYTLNLILGKKDVKFDVTVATWVTGNTQNVNLPN